MKTSQKYFLTISLLLTLNIFSISQWQFCGNYTGSVVQAIEKDSCLIAGTYGNGVYITTDGVNWTYSNQGMTNGQIISFAIINNSVFAGSESGGVYRSNDNGYNWTPVNNGISNYTIHWLSSCNGNLYAATSDGVNMTTNNGESWTKISNSSIGTIIFTVAAYSNKVIAASANGVFITSNGGVSWDNISSGISSYIYCLSVNNDVVYAGSSLYGVFKTSNHGSNWIQSNSGLPSGKAVRTISFGEDKIFAALYNSGGIYYLPEWSSSWIPSNEGLTQLSCFTVIKFHEYLYAGTMGGIFRRPLNEFTLVNKIDYSIPKEFKLSQNYPNPFNPTTKIKFEIPNPKSETNSKSEIRIYDLLGNEVAVLVNEKLSPGTYEVEFNGNNFSSGVYFYRLITDGFTETRKMILLK